KLKHICRKLRLKPRQRLLDIGCGWGGLAIFASQHCGVKVDGITLSEHQASLASTRVGDAGLAGEVNIELRDYRDIDETGNYDSVVSVGMSEHVGAKNLAGYFAKAAGVMAPGGVFLNHAIGEG